MIVSGSNAANYTTQYFSDDLLVEVITEEQANDPSLVNAVIRDNLRAVKVNFDRPIQADKLQVSPTILSNIFACSELFSFKGADTDECTFGEGRTFVLILLNYDSVLLPADTITLLPAKLSAISKSHSVELLPPKMKRYPKININTQDKIGTSQNLFPLPPPCAYHTFPLSVCLFLLLSYFLFPCIPFNYQLQAHVKTWMWTYLNPLVLEEGYGGISATVLLQVTPIIQTSHLSLRFYQSLEEQW